MNSLILMLAMLGQSPDFGMLPSEPQVIIKEVIKEVPIIKEVIKEVPVYYMADSTGKQWYDKDLNSLQEFVKKKN